jgi:hypothetical protein
MPKIKSKRVSVRNSQQTLITEVQDGGSIGSMDGEQRVGVQIENSLRRISFFLSSLGDFIFYYFLLFSPQTPVSGQIGRLGENRSSIEIHPFMEIP